MPALTGRRCCKSAVDLVGTNNFSHETQSSFSPSFGRTNKYLAQSNKSRGKSEATKKRNTSAVRHSSVRFCTKLRRKYHEDPTEDPTRRRGGPGRHARTGRRQRRQCCQWHALLGHYLLPCIPARNRCEHAQAS